MFRPQCQHITLVGCHFISDRIDIKDSSKYCTFASIISPNRRPAVLSQVLLVLGMQTTQQLGRHLAQLVVVDTQMVHAPVGQLISVMQLQQQQQQLTAGPSDQAFLITFQTRGSSGNLKQILISFFN